MITPKSTFISVLVSVVLVAVPGNCKAQEPNHRDANLRVGVEQWIFSSLPIKEIREKFALANPQTNLSMESLTGGEINESIRKIAIGKCEYDLILVSGGASGPESSNLKSTLPWNDFFTEIPRQDFVSCFIINEQGTNAIHSLPLFGEMQLLFYAPETLRSSAPNDTGKMFPALETWMDVEKLAFSLKRDSDADGSIDTYGMAADFSRVQLFYGIWTHVVSSGGVFLDQDGNYNLKSKNVRDAVSFWKNLVGKEILLPGAWQKDEISKGFLYRKRAAMCLSGSRMDKLKRINLPYQEYEIAFTLPPGAKKNGTVVYPAAEILLPAGGNAEAARKFTRDILLSRWLQDKMANDYGMMPVLKSCYAELKEPYWQELVGCAEISPALPAFENNAQMVEVISFELGRAIMGLKTVDQAIEDAYVQLRQLRR